MLFLEADVTYKINMQVTNVLVTCLHYPYITFVCMAHLKSMNKTKVCRPNLPIVLHTMVGPVNVHKVSEGQILKCLF